jgi:hypothetical protein
MTRYDLKLPPHTSYYMGLHSGRFASAVIVAIIGAEKEEDAMTLVVDEIPNYQYVGDGQLESLNLTTTQWGDMVVDRWRFFAPRIYPTPWVDPETTFTKELRRCKMRLRRNVKRSPELRTQVTKEYFHLNMIKLSPWLSVLPAELFAAKWPEDDGGAAERETGADYTLSALEHVLSRRPRPRKPETQQRSSFLDEYFRQHKRSGPGIVDPHLGAQ